MRSRVEKEKLNIAFSLIQQVVTLICGLIAPKLLLDTFGSEAYGATTSIATFLSYITLLESGIGALSRSALYKAFANKSAEQIGAIVYETKKFYKRLALVFSAYVLIIALFFNQISHSNVFDFWYSFSLVIVIALSTFAEFFIGISYTVMIQADQRSYVPAIFRIISTILNTALIVVLVFLDFDILTVKLFSSLVFVLRPVLLALYVKREYKIKEVKSDTKYLTQKGSALGQHIAWTLHNNTDVTVLTIFKDLSLVSVYSVYNMVINQLQNLLFSFSSGMEAIFGNMLANNEKERLLKTFGYYETYLSLLSITVFSTASILIIPFVKLYTANITDVNYIYPVFAVTLMFSSFIYCIRIPYMGLTVAAGHFKKTNLASFGEAFINIVLSVIFVMIYGISGVALGTLIATLFRFVYYAFYLTKNIIKRPLSFFLKRLAVNCVSFFAVIFAGNAAIKNLDIDNFFVWALCGCAVFIATAAVALGVNYIFYKEDVIAVFQKGFGKFIKRKG